MKKALVATCVVAMTVFGITNASADPVRTARANAFGIDIGGSLLDDLIEREPEVTSVFPPGGQEIEDIINLDVDPITVDAAGAVIAETARDSTIVPLLGGEDQGGGGGGGGDGGDEGLLGGIFEDLLGGGGDGGGGGGLLGSNSVSSFEAQQLGGGGGEGDEGLLGGLLGDEELLGGLLNNEEGGDVEDDEIVIPAANARGFARITDLNLLIEDEGGLEGLDDTLQTLLLDALLEIDTINAEAVAVCVGNQVFFDTASNILSVNDEPVTLVDDLLDAVEDLELLEDIIDIERNEVGVTADGNGIFVNALHITIGNAIGGEGDGGTLGGDTLGGGDGGGGGGDEGLVGGITDGGDGGDGGGGGGVTDAVESVVGGEDSEENTVEAQQLGGGDDGDGGGLLGGGGDDEALLDIVLGHAEVSATECAPPPAAPPAQLTPTGDNRPSLPRTGGLGVLPGILGVGLLGGALTAGRLALRSRRGNNL
ncbi:MAG: hypothetical protein KY447_02005 [Actinobacteria bacterium]|nr:hypothetical protein [Actinomycetota bacterium]MBW3641672.1 hypothetical protein [Actinomycetota bacterium]